MILPSANNVNWAKVQRLKVPLNAMLVMLEDLAKPKVFVQYVRMVFIKIRKDKKSALIPVTCWKKYPTQNARGVNCHRGVFAK